jgi:hypothetical protein
MNFEYSRKIFEKYWNIKSHKNPSSGAELFHADWRADRHVEANILFSHFCEHIKAEQGDTSVVAALANRNLPVLSTVFEMSRVVRRLPWFNDGNLTLTFKTSVSTTPRV